MNTRLKGRTPLAKGAGFLEEFTKDEIKRKVDIVSLMESFGVKLEKKGSSYMGLCPFHEDTNPSLSVDRDKGLFNCFGCGEGGDVFDFVMKTQGVDFPEALKILKEFPSGTSVSFSPSVHFFPRPSITKAEPPGASLSLKDIVTSYSRNLETSKIARDYLKSRGLLIPEFLKRFCLGYSDGELPERIGEEQKRALRDIGIITPKGKEHFGGCVTVSLRDFQNQAVSLYGRRITKGNLKHLYIGGPHRGLLNPEGYKAYPDRMIWAESIIDALSLMAIGFENTDALYGTNGLSEAHLQALKEGRTKEIILALDNDEAGRRSASELAGKLKEEGISTRAIFPPDPFKDWNEFLIEVGIDGVGNPQAVIEGLITESVLNLAASLGLKVTEKNGRYTVVSFTENGEVTYEVIGVKDGFISSLKVNVRATFEDRKFIDNVDLFSARSRSLFASCLSRSFNIESAKVEKDLVDILEYLESGSNGEENDREPPVVTPVEKEEGLAFLRDSRLFERIEEDLEEVGYVGESVNKKLMYIAASSRKMDSPISIIVHSQSASGKSYLIDTVKKLMPPEDVVSMTSLSDQALNYMEDEALLHKFLTLGEAVHSEAIEYQLREMLSGGELSRLVTTKDEKTGRMTSKMMRKKVIVSMVMSTTSSDINEENASRSFLISTDESRAQTEAIHQRQREKYSVANYQRKEEAVPAIIKRHQAAQRLLEKRKIVNPFAVYLDFPSSRMRTRRDHERFIDLIAAVCFLRQFQKKSQGSYLECDIEDYRIAYELMSAVLPSTLGELPSSASMVYEALKNLIEKRSDELDVPLGEIWITQRELREYTGLGHELIKKNLRRLSEWEHVKVKGSSRGATKRYGLNTLITQKPSNILPFPEDIAKRVQVGSSVTMGSNSLSIKE